jgi:hypothetical protein
MSEILELVLELMLNLAGCFLEAMTDIWLGDLTWPDNQAGRISWCAVLLVLAGLIWWELR